MANAFLLKPLPLVTASASSTSVGAATNLDLDYAGVVWSSSSATTATLTFELAPNFSANLPVDTIMIFGLAGAAADATMTVRLQTAAGGEYPIDTLPLYAGTIRPDAGGGIAIWTAPAGQTYTVYRALITITNVSAAVVTASRVVIGKRVQLERNFSFGAAFGVRDFGSLDFSTRGVVLRQRSKKLRTVSLTFANIRKDEVEATTRPLLEKIGNTEMIALVTDPAADPQRQNRCYFGPLVGDLSQTWRSAASWEAKVNLVSIF